MQPHHVPVVMSVSCGDVTRDTVFASCRISYWMADLSHSPANYFRFLTIAFSADLVMSSMFRATVFFTPTQMAAQASWLCCAPAAMQLM